MQPAQYWIDRLGLQPHPEGGFFKETYRAGESLAAESLPARFGGPRSVATGIYFLLRAGDISHFHRIESDEMWHFYSGGPLDVHVITDDGAHEVLKLGADFDAGQSFQAVVPAGCWFGSCPAQGTNYALVGCTVAPGFDFADFEMAKREALLARYPAHAGIINRLTLP